MSLQHDRTLLRNKALSLRDNLEPEVHESGSLSITEHVLNHPRLKRFNFIFLYLSYRSEVDTWLLAQELLDLGKILCVPQISGPGKMKARQIKSLDDDLEKGPMGIASPVSITKEIDPRLIDLILAPGLLFDDKGTRVGYGGGFYDRFLQQVREGIEVWGLCFEEQMSPQPIPRNEWDIPMTALVRPSGFSSISS